MATTSRQPPAPPSLLSKEQLAQVAEHLKLDRRSDQGDESGDPVERLRSHLTDAQDSISEALDVLDEIDAQGQ